MRFIKIAFCISSFLVSSSLLGMTSASTGSDAAVIRAVVGLDAVIPCGVNTVVLDGLKASVVWTRGNKRIITRFLEANNKNPEVQIRYQNQKGAELERLGVTRKDPTTLRIIKAEEEDEGMYHCSVKYQSLPEENYYFQLQIVDSPGRPKIFNQYGFDLSGNVTFLRLGSNLTLNCYVKDSDGTLLWWERNGEKVARAEVVQDGVIQSTVKILNATRNELDAHYMCLAQNADVTNPLSASVFIKMDLPPLSVEIRLDNNVNFELGQPRVVDCVVIGCQPPPTISWSLGGNTLRPTFHKETHDGNFTMSSLTLAPTLRDDKDALICFAHNIHMPTEVFTDEVNISVGLRPRCLSDQHETIGFVPGETEEITCSVEAFPEPWQFSWTFANNEILYTSIQKHGVYNRYYSTLAWKPQAADEGELQCRAINKFGEQKQPCIFFLVAGGPPRAPDCDIKSTELDIVTIRCEKSWDGGRPATFHLELLHRGVVLKNVSDFTGQFTFPQLQKKDVTAVLYASNSRGRSAKVILPIAMNSNMIDKLSDVDPENTMPLPKQLVIATAVLIVLVGGVIYLIKVTKECAPPSAPPSVSSSSTSDITRTDGNFRRQPQFHPLTDGQSCPQVSLQVPDSSNYVKISPSKAARVLGILPESPATRHVRLQCQNTDETISYYL